MSERQNGILNPWQQPLHRFVLQRAEFFPNSPEANKARETFSQFDKNQATYFAMATIGTLGTTHDHFIRTRGLALLPEVTKLEIDNAGLMYAYLDTVIKQNGTDEDTITALQNVVDTEDKKFLVNLCHNRNAIAAITDAWTEVADKAGPQSRIQRKITNFVQTINQFSPTKQLAKVNAMDILEKVKEKNGIVSQAIRRDFSEQVVYTKEPEIVERKWGNNEKIIELLAMGKELSEIAAEPGFPKSLQTVDQIKSRVKVLKQILQEKFALASLPSTLELILKSIANWDALSISNIREAAINLDSTSLTRQERNILETYISLALANKNPQEQSVASEFDISRFTIKSHTRNILKKLGVRNKIQAVALYYVATHMPE